ncbi:MAG TPA: YIP1 family protein [Vicinamibacterales bacterium]|jgi:hypothetical protein
MASFGERVVGAMRADVKTFQEIEADKAAMGQAVGVILLSGVAALIGNIFRQPLRFAIGSLIMSVLGAALWALIVTVVGTKLMPEPTTKADFSETFRVVGFSTSPGLLNILAIIPFLGPLISFVIWLWCLVVMVVGVREVLDYSNTGRAIIVCLIGMVITFIVYVMILGPIFIGSAIVSNM